MNEDCASFRDLLSAFADGELPAAEAVRVREHLRSCRSCRDAVDAYAVADAAVAEIGTWRAEAEWEQLAERIDSAVARQPLPNAGPLATARAEKRRLRDRFGPRRLSLALGSAGTLLAAMLVLLLRPLSEDLAPVDTVPPLGTTGAGRSEEAKAERGDAPPPTGRAPADPAPRESTPPAATSPEIGHGIIAPAEPRTPGTAAVRSLGEAAAPPSEDRRESLGAQAPADPAPERERLRALGYIDGGASPSPRAAERTVAPGGGVVELLHSVDKAEALLAENPERERRAEILGTLVGLWAELVTIDPGHHCAAASRAASGWEAFAPADPAPAELDAVRRIREACPE